MKRLLFILLLLPLFSFGQFTQNYRKADTTLVFNHNIEYGDTYWTDLRLAINGTAAGAAAPDLEAVAGSTVKAWAFAGGVANEEVYLEGQFPHGVVDSADIEVHLHIAPATSPAGTDTAVVQVELLWQRYGAAFNTGANDTTFTIDIPLGAYAQWEHALVDLGMMNAIGRQQSSIILARVTRLQNNASDTYADDLFIFTLDLHYQISAPGSDEETPDY